MNKRNSERVKMVQFHLANHATKEVGLVAKDISKATGISRPAVNRIVADRALGFFPATYPTFPTGYYYDPHRTIEETIANNAIERAEKEAEFRRSMPKIRDYNKSIDDYPVVRVINGVTNPENLVAFTNALNEYRTKFIKVMDNVKEFKSQNAALDIELAQSLYSDGVVIQHSVETMYRGLDRLKNPIENPEWWSEIE